MKIDYKQLEFIDPTLREILSLIEASTGVEFTITSLYRIGDDGPHGTLPLRATDLRCRTSTLGLAVETLVNSRFRYDSDRPAKQCAIYHDAGSGAHIHLQVHPNTRRR